jgi:nucleoside-diphosphate-sugar epimerase
MEYQIWVLNETTPLSKAIIRHFDKTNVVNLNPQLDFFRTFQSFITGEYEIDVFDPTLPKLINQYETDYIISSFPVSREQAIDSPELAFRNNIEGLYRLAQFAATNRIRLIHINYFTNYDNYSFRGITEMCNTFIEEVFKFSGVNYTILEPPLLYNEAPYNPIYDLLESYYTDPKNIYFDPDTSLAMMHIDDFVYYVEKAILSFQALRREAHIIPSPQIYTFEHILERFDRPIQYMFNPEKDEIADDVAEEISTNTVFADIRPQVPLSDGLDRISQVLEKKYG